MQMSRFFNIFSFQQYDCLSMYRIIHQNISTYLLFGANIIPDTFLKLRNFKFIDNNKNLKIPLKILLLAI